MRFLPRCRRPRSTLRLTPRRSRSLVTLAIETSCDDTGVAILQHTPKSTELLFNERISSDNRAFKGIHPLVAVKGHSAALAPLVRRALEALPSVEEVQDGSGDESRQYCLAAGVRKQIPDFVSVTRGPGMRSNLGIGLDMAKGLAVAWGVPLVGVHHMQAHALTPRLVRALGMSMGENLPTSEEKTSGTGPEFPFLSLLVSGGHTQLVHSSSLTDHSIIATSGDIAIGNLLDQTARDILPAEVFDASDHVMYGRLLEAFAFPPSDDLATASHDAMTSAYEAVFTPPATRSIEMTPPSTGYDWNVPTPFRQTRKLAFSFSSIYTHVHNLASSSPSMPLAERRALAQHTMIAAFTHLAGRLCVALEDRPELRSAKTLVVAGGVASNRFLMHVLRRMLAVRGFGDMQIVAPPVELCTDNAAMIAWTGMEMFQAGWESEVSITGIGKWPMDPEHGEGILGVDGWVRRD
ncbi:sialoglycoprotease (gcp) [Fusarium albosuccineum]|uniref:N(6)-L-threonylcarbamoyladenine synthase n=1 Tax=Fusarium albosuccineum TaxID=1237068 RepID=A0A8H4P9W2_9HYPO|nr:sialoglycoprotease (gcp) [Fusarium albosuccineum]